MTILCALFSEDDLRPSISLKQSQFQLKSKDIQPAHLKELCQRRAVNGPPVLTAAKHGFDLIYEYHAGSETTHERLRAHQSRSVR